VRDEHFREAEKKIEEARRTGATELVLDTLSLPELPKSAGRLVRLRTLQLPRSRLTALPESLGQLTQLNWFNLGDNELETLPDSLSQLAQLKTLYLNGNRLTALPECLGQLTNLQTLSLSRNQLTALPEWLGQLTNLQTLDLDNNQLTALPEWLGQLTNLLTLSLRSNQLTALPEWLGQLTNLLTLDLIDNQLTALPEWLGQLTNLQTLSLSRNQLTSVPEWLGQLTNLQALDLNDNQLTSVPEFLGQLTNLQALDLSNSQLTSVPECLGQLTNLQALDLDRNQLTSLPESLGQLTNLQTLYLYSNQLTSVPEFLGQLTNLQTLSLKDNQLTSVPEFLGQLAQLQALDLSNSQLTSVPECLGQLTNLLTLDLDGNRLTSLPESLGQLTNLLTLYLSSNQLTSGPEFLGQLAQLEALSLKGNQLTSVPECLGQLTSLLTLDLDGNQLTSLPESLGQLTRLDVLRLDGNPLNPELAAAYEHGTDVVMQYLRAKAEGTVVLNEAKLILIGEGEVGKSCLLDALRDEPWQEHETTHGINIEPVEVTDPETKTEITLSGWDFGGQRVYRPTHQLFFSAPAVYLVVWKPREGSQAGQVREWIKLVKHREPDAKILIVATHGGPRERQPDIDQHELTSQFGSDTVLGFFHVDSKPNVKRHRRGINELRDAIAGVAMQLPEMGREVPTKWQNVRERLAESTESWMSYEDFVNLCMVGGIDGDQVDLFATLSHTLGNLIHYDYDTALRDIVILKPDWLATAISFVLDDAETRANHGLVSFERLSQLWDDPEREPEERYPEELHPAFLRLMERFDLSYDVQLPQQDAPKTILVSQLVPEAPPNALPEWDDAPAAVDIEQVQICRIVDDRGQSATAEGLFYQLIVRLHKYSLGREDYHDSVHWRRGLMLDNDYNGRALLEHIGNDVKITVRAAFPERFLAILTGEVKWLVESFWEGLRCEVTVPCAEPCGKAKPGTALFEVQKLIAFKQQGLEKFPCIVSGCDQLQDIECLLRNATARPAPDAIRMDQFDEVMEEMKAIRNDVKVPERRGLSLFRALHSVQRRRMSQVDDQFAALMQTLTDEAKEGPRLFSFEAVETGFFDRPNWIAETFRLTLWCEHARLPLPELNDEGDDSGVYELELTRDWVKKAAPFLKGLTTTLSLVLPVASSATKLLMDDVAYDRIANELDFGQKCADSLLKGSHYTAAWLDDSDDPAHWEWREAIRSEGGTLRELHAMLKKKDPSSGFGGLVRVQNKRREFLWVHEQFVDEY